MNVSGNTSLSVTWNHASRAHLLSRCARLRQVAEAAIGDLAELVVVVEDHAAVAGDAEVLE